MKLTKYHRDAFIRAVLDDIPKINYEEEARKLVYEDSIAQMPPELQKLARDNTKNQWLRMDTFWRHAFRSSFSVFEPRGGNYKPSAACQAKLEELEKANNEQIKRLDDVESKISASISACSTLKVAKERLPEFEKYLPDEPNGGSSDNLPAIANLVADLSKLGWPKDKKDVASKASESNALPIT